MADAKSETGMMKVKGKVDQEVKPGELVEVTIKKAGNGGCILMYRHAPTKQKGAEYPMYSERKEDAFGSLEDAFHAAAQAFGMDSSLEEYEEEPAGKGKAA